MVRILFEEIQQRVFDSVDPMFLSLYLKMMSKSSQSMKKVLLRVENLFRYLEVDSQISIAFELLTKKITNESLWTEITEVFEDRVASYPPEKKVPTQIHYINAIFQNSKTF